MPSLQCEAWFIPRLPSHPGAPQGEGHQGEGHWGEGHWGEGHWGEGHWGEGHWGEGHPGEGHLGEGYRGDHRHLPIRRVATAPHRHRRCFQLPQLLADLVPLGEVFAASQAPKPLAH
jgi:hypothetical protein